MHSLYNSFYQQADEQNSDEDNDFQAWQDEPQLLNQFNSKQNQKITNNTALSTKNTSKIHTALRNSEHFSLKFSQIGDESTVCHEKICQKNTKPNNYKNYNTIQTSINCIQKIVKSYKGKRQQTINLNKYYVGCLKDHVQTLSTCRIIDTDEGKKYIQQIKLGNMRKSVQKSSVEARCQNYVKSTCIIKKVLTSQRMSFHNKIIALKYAGTLAAKVSGTVDNKNWKKFNS